MNRFNDARIFVIQEQTIAVGSGSRTSLPVQFVLQNQDLDKLKEAIPKFLAEVRKDKTFSNVDVNLKFNKPEVDITFDRMKIKDLGLSTQDVISAMQSAFSGGRLAYFIQERISVSGDRAGGKNRPERANGYLQTVCPKFQGRADIRFHSVIEDGTEQHAIDALSF